MPENENDFGKCKTYRCPKCGAVCFRTLHEVPSPCKLCGQKLDVATFRVDDVIVSTRTQDYMNKKIG